MLFFLFRLGWDGAGEWMGGPKAGPFPWLLPWSFLTWPLVLDCFEAF